MTWWLTLLAHLFVSVSGTVTFFRLGLGPVYQHMQAPQQQMDMMRRMGFLNTSAPGYFSILSGVLFLAYFLWIKRFFKAP
jgi:hypothetical protein